MTPTRLEEHIRELARIFRGRGKQLFLVGGSVRDQLLGRPVSDHDLTTDARPEEVKELASLVSPNAIYLVGERFGTVGLVFGKTKVEVTTFRTEKYQPMSRWPDVAFTGSLDGDLRRRDFTVNAMAQDPLSSEIFDPTGGRIDLKHQVIRAVGEPAERFSEDPLRLLRAVRFASQLGFTIDEKTAKAICDQAGMLSTVSAERIGEEANRIMLSPHPGHGLRLAKDLGLLKHIIPEMLPLQYVRQGPNGPRDAFEHVLTAAEAVRPLLDVRWAAALHDIAKQVTLSRDEAGVHFYDHQVIGAEMAEAILSRLRLDRRTINTVVRLVHLHMRPLQYDGTWTDGAVRRLMIDAGEDLGKLMEIARADLLGHDAGEEDIASLAELEARCLTLAETHDVPGMKSPLDGSELMAIFGKGPGPWLRQVKEHLLEQVVEGNLAPDDKPRAEQMARRFMESVMPKAGARGRRGT